jgi:hypothetical protein
MQVHESSLKGADRPRAPKGCAKCAGCQKLHRNGTYSRFRKVQGQRQCSIPRFRCPGCGRTWSVIPADMFPRRSMEVSRFESLMDALFGLAGGGARPPPATEIEAGCIRRACKRVSERIALLCGFLGQQMPLRARTDVGCFWRALRELGSTEDILVRLACDFKTSLLACYRSLAMAAGTSPRAGA